MRAAVVAAVVAFVVPADHAAATYGSGTLTPSLGHTVSVVVPGPTGVTCMSITEGTLRVRVAGLQAPAGSYLVKAQIRRHAFTARLRIS
jgi:hypothetical protein